MKRGNQTVVLLALACLLIVAGSTHLTFAQKQKASPPPPPPPRTQVSPHPDQAQPRAHAGDWLRRYADVPPEEQEHALQNDPAFRRLPAERQEKLRQRLQHFSSLTPEQQLRMLNRMETWEHLTPQQKQEARQVFGDFRQLPPDRKRVVYTAIEELRAMNPQLREQVINSDKFKGMFSDPERELMRGAAKLPLSPPQVEESAPQEQERR